jgi:hypothetical protein
VTPGRPRLSQVLLTVDHEPASHFAPFAAILDLSAFAGLMLIAGSAGYSLNAGRACGRCHW